MLAGNYNYKCDIWSIGVIAYMLLSGVPPFHGADDKATLQSVREGKWKFFDSLFKFISPAAKDFISTCLERQMNVRPSAMMAMKHEWFDMLKIPDAPVDISDNIVERIRGFERRSTLSKLCMEILSHNLALGQIEHLHQEFMKIDRHKIGEISYGELRNVLNCQVISGELTDEEVKNLFVGVNFDQTGMIQYHEFLAATISRKAITEENMRIAFERMSNSSSFVTGTDLCDLLGLDVTSDQVAAIVHEIQMMPGERIDFKQVPYVTLHLKRSAYVSLPSHRHILLWGSVSYDFAPPNKSLIPTQFKRIMLSGTSSSLVRRREGFYPSKSSIYITRQKLLDGLPIVMPSSIPCFFYRI